MLKRVIPDLVMSAKRSVWRMNDHAGEADKAFNQIRLPVLEACGNVCEFCGHASAKFQEAHHGDDDHSNNRPENLFGSCPLCHQVFHVGLAGMRDGGVIIYLPEFTQAELNQLALLIWIVQATREEMIKEASALQMFKRIHASATKLSSVLENRRGPVLMRLNDYVKKNKALAPELEPKLSDINPALFANVLMQLDDATYAKRAEELGGLRLLPKPARFEQRIEHWRDEANAILPVPSWTKILSHEDIHKLVVACMGRVDAAEKRVAALG